MSRHFILTGAPGAGKTVLIRQLELGGHHVVEEAATDVIALQQALGVGEPWQRPRFVADIAELQLRRQALAQQSGRNIHFHDRSLFCTYALAQHLGHPVPPVLQQAIAEALTEGFFQRRVFLVRLLGFVTRTEARRIGLEEAMEFERVHEEVYRRFGFDIVPVEQGGVVDRAGEMLAAVEASLT
ncbi:MAG TPA: AAA family ATPase [Devosiaceae bacterium]|jgi:predicted ATPase|nr:AAA family ATPase [Devosiaceae bacterium]